MSTQHLAPGLCPWRLVLVMGLVLLSEPLRAAAEAPKTDALSALRSDAVQSDTLVRRVVYTWTTRQQIAELRQRPLLLTRTESPVYGPSHFDLVVQRRAEAGDPFARLLRRPAFRRARFAWSNPWATLRGWDNESYGDQLLRVTLREEAWIVVYRTTAQGFYVVDGRNQEVELKEVLRTPRRLAAVYFFNDQARGGTYATFGANAKAPYREYVLCNEAMVASWEAGTDAIRSELQRSLATISALRTELAERKAPLLPTGSWAQGLLARWRQTSPPATALEAYELALAFANERYHPELTQLDALILALQSSLTAQPRPLHH